MQIQQRIKFVVALVATAAALANGASADAQNTRTAPTRVNANSVRTATGQPLLRTFRAGEPAQEYQGGFVHLYPGRSASQPQEQPEAPQPARIARAQFSRTQSQSPENDLLPPLPSDQGEEVMGVRDPQVDDPIFMESQVYGEGVAVEYPSDGFMAAECGSCKTGKCFGHGGKGGKSAGGLGDWNWACFCLPLPPLDNLSFNFGAHGFKDQLSGGFDDSFGFQEGFNLGAPLNLGHLGIGWQIGLQGVQSNFSGAGSPLASGVLTNEERNQLFFTWGFFRRVDCGLQGGFVFDHRRDEWYYDDIDVSQTRGEISYMHDCNHEYGVFFNTSTESDVIDGAPLRGTAGNLTVDPTDLVALFYRHHFDDCGFSFMKLYVGLTDDRNVFDSMTDESSVIFGGNMHVGLSDCWALETGFTYLSANDDVNAAQQEDWNVAFNLIWYPHGQGADTMRRYYRPLFNVADNGTMPINVGP